jgi:membrane fusion protein, multidrug efflux system
LVNGRAVRISSPIDGEIQAFYARPGIAVKSGQVLARLAPTTRLEDDTSQIQGEIQNKTAQIAATQQSVNFLKQQLQSLQQQDRSLRRVNVTLAASNVAGYRAAVDAALAQETAARREYQRYQSLLLEGIVSKQQVDQLEARLNEVSATVNQARAELSTAQTSDSAVAEGVTVNQSDSLQPQQFSLLREIQDHTTAILTLQAQVKTLKEQLEQVKSAANQQSESHVISAPFSGVIYSTEHDEGELVARPTTLMTLLDCNDLWVATLMSTEQAQKVDAKKPVRVQLAGAKDTFVGEVDLVESVTPAELAKEQAQALIPALPPKLVGVPLSKVTVKIPPIPQQASSQEFCGVGQFAKVTFGTTFSIF